MAKRNGYSIRMNNSDDTDRKYDIACKVDVSDAGEVNNVSDVTVTRKTDGMGVGNGHFSVTGEGGESSHITVNGLTLAETTECLAETTAFIQQAVNEAARSTEEC